VEQHLHRYLAKFDFRYNTRPALGYADFMRAADRAALSAKARRFLAWRLRRITNEVGAFCRTGEHVGVRKSHKFDGRANGDGAALQCSEGETDPGLPEHKNPKLRAGD
jgi:hypothetical protein